MDRETDYGKYAQIILIIALLVGYSISILDSQTASVSTKKIEENYSKALDEDMVASRAYENFTVETVALVDAHLSYMNEFLSGNKTEYERKNKELDERITKFRCVSNNTSIEYKKSLSNATKLKGEIIKAQKERDEGDKNKPFINVILFIILILALVLTWRQKDHAKESLAEIKNLENHAKESLAEIKDLKKELKVSKEDPEENKELDSYSMQIYV